GAGGIAMIRELIADAEERMTKSVGSLRHNLQGLRAGRANPGLLEKVRVDYYGTPTPVNQVATISVPEPRLLVIQPWDKTVLGALEKAILKSDIGLTPSSDGTVIRLAIPQLTEQRRQELVKTARRLGEEERVAIRNIRREIREMMEEAAKEGEVSEDEARRGQEELQKLTDRMVEQVGQILEAKEKEIMEV
ncbi:MAG TPA: ribosome recycling factor, partial [Bacillota bacterium]|nr:ribosome recycling factor [Bacillota bacterium]